MDKSRTTETARLDRIAFPARSDNAAPALTDLGARHVASARCRSRIGQDWFTKHSLRPGAFVRIDPRQKKIPSVNWHSDDRPIFFIELRERYVCTWCELHDGRLILIPTQQSKRRSQQVRYPAEATIIGRVTGVSMDLVVEPSEHEARA